MVETFLVKWTLNYLYMIAFLEIIVIFLLKHNIYLIFWKNLTLLKSEASSGKPPRADLHSHPVWSFRSCSSSLFTHNNTSNILFFKSRSGTDSIRSKPPGPLQESKLPHSGKLFICCIRVALLPYPPVLGHGRSSPIWENAIFTGI